MRQTSPNKWKNISARNISLDKNADDTRHSDSESGEEQSESNWYIADETPIAVLMQAGAAAANVGAMNVESIEITWLRSHCYR